MTSAGERFRRLRRRELRLPLERAKLLVAPLLDLGQVGQSIDDRSARRAERGPSRTLSPGGERAPDGVLIDHDDVGGERVDANLHLGPHGPRERDEHFLPEELITLEATHALGAVHQRTEYVVRHAVVEREELRPFGEERADTTGVCRPGDGVPARLKGAGDGDGRVHVTGERRNDEEKAHHPRSSAVSRTKSTTSSRTRSVASQRTEWVQPGKVTTRQRGMSRRHVSPRARRSEVSP